jgi:predicted permease
MSGLKRLRRRVWAFFAKKALDAELEAELEAHMQLAIDELMEHGMPLDEARRLALIQFGGVQQAREKQREARGLMQVDILLQDLKYTTRKLMRDPGFTVVAVLILALGIGANVAVFSVVNTIMLRPLPFPNAQELVWIAPPPAKCGLSCATYSTDSYDEFRASTRSFQDVTGYFAFSSPGNLKLRIGNGSPVPATGIDVIQNFFSVLGVQPAKGRLFRPEDARNGAAPVIILTDAWWRRQFNADPDIVGKAFDINGTQTTVIGVLPRTFDFGAVFAPGTKVDALTPLNLYGPPRDWGNIITMIGRMKPGVTLGQAVGDSKAASRYMCWNNNYPKSCGDYKDAVVPVPLKDYVTGRLRQSLKVLWTAVGMILLIACVNLSNLLLARAMARSKEFALRGALGAGRGRIVRQLLTESLVLSGGGAIIGLLLAEILVVWLRSQGAIALPLLSQLHIDASALGWALLLATASAILFGLVPALRISAGKLHEALKDSGAGSGQSRKHERLRAVLVVSEVALACVLLVGAGLLLRSFMQVLSVDLGFQPERAAAVAVDFNDDPADGDGNSKESSDKILAHRAAHFQPIIDRVSALPGVEAAGVTDYLPLGGNRSWGLPFPRGATRPQDLHIPGPLVYVVSPGYLRAMGTRLRGRDFSWNDRRGTEQVVIIDSEYAKYLSAFVHWPNNDPVGQLIYNGDKDTCDGGVCMRIIGVADNVHAESVEGENGWQIYYPGAQTFWGTPQLVARTTMPLAQMAKSVMSVLRDANPKQTAAEFKPIQMLVDHANSPRRFFLLLVGSFAALGLLLAALGIYGVISYSVTRQTQEIGIRMALGASAGRVRKQVLISTLRLAAIGVVAGAVVSIATSRLLASLLFNTSPWDSFTYVAMAVALLAVAAVAGYVPALRASRVSPLIALRSE